MNSKSKCFNDNGFENEEHEQCERHEHGERHEQKCCCCEPKCHGAHCKPLHPLPTCSLLACGQGSGVAIPLSTAANPFFIPIPIASVTIDTTCLCNPTVKIDFNSIINYQALVTAGTITTPFTVTFQLSKTCDEGTKIALGTWDFTFGIVSALVNVTESFGFTHCQCNSCPGCCVYTVEIVRATGALGTAVAPAVFTITENASIRSSSISAQAASHN